MNAHLALLFPVFLIAIAIRNIWPQKMGLKAFAILYALLLLASLPTPLLVFKKYGLFGMLLTVCLYGLFSFRDTRHQNICMGLWGCVLAIIIENLLTGIRTLSFLGPVSENPYIELCGEVIYVILFYFITLLCGKVIRKKLLNSKGILQLHQVWYLIDAALLLFIIVFLFQDIVRGDTTSVAVLIYYNVLLFSGYFLVSLFLFLSMFQARQEKMQTEAKQRAFQDLQDYTHNLESMYDQLRSFKHDYINILTSLSGYIDKDDMTELKDFFEKKILPTKSQITQGDYKLNQLGNIGVLEIKSLLSAKMIYAHEAGIDVTIDIPEHVPDFSMDTVDLARILGIFLDNAIEAALETADPKVGLNILQNLNSTAIIINNSFQDNGIALHQLKQKGFSTKENHQGIGLSNARKIIGSYDNVLFETVKKDGCFTQYLEITVNNSSVEN